MAKPEGWSSDDWSTPPEFIAKVEALMGLRFDLDPCCVRETAKGTKFYTVVEDGLKQEWAGTVWLNPPYSNPLPWVKKAAHEAARGVTTVALLPPCTDTGWFHDWVLPYARLIWIRGRIRFHGWEGTPIGSPKQPNLLAVFGPWMPTNIVLTANGK